MFDGKFKEIFILSHTSTAFRLVFFWICHEPVPATLPPPTNRDPTSCLKLLLAVFLLLLWWTECTDFTSCNVSCIYSLCGVHCPCPPSSFVHLLCHVNYFPFFVFYPFLAVLKMLTSLHGMLPASPNCGVSPLFLAPSVFLVLMPVLKSNIFLSAAAEREKVGMESKRRSFAACHLFPLPSRHLGNLVFIS